MGAFGGGIGDMHVANTTSREFGDLLAVPFHEVPVPRLDVSSDGLYSYFSSTIHAWLGVDHEGDGLSNFPDKELGRICIHSDRITIDGNKVLAVFDVNAWKAERGLVLLFVIKSTEDLSETDTIAEDFQISAKISDRDAWGTLAKVTLTLDVGVTRTKLADKESEDVVQIASVVDVLKVALVLLADCEPILTTHGGVVEVVALVSPNIPKDLLVLGFGVDHGFDIA